MRDTDKPQTEEERIIREHRKWTRRIEGRTVVGVGNLVLTNRRLLFLHRISGSREVAANIKKMSDAPIQAVLDYALALKKSNLQIPLSSILNAKVGILAAFPLPRFCLNVLYLDAKKRTCRATFRFERLLLQLLTHPQNTPGPDESLC